MRAQRVAVVTKDTQLGHHSDCDEEQHAAEALFISAATRKSKLLRGLQESALVSQDTLQHQTAITYYSDLYKQHRQHVAESERLLNLPDSKTLANYCPPLAAALIVLAGALLVQPQGALQLLTGLGVSTNTSTLGSCFARFTGLVYLFLGITSLIAYVSNTCDSKFVQQTHST